MEWRAMGSHDKAQVWAHYMEHQLLEAYKDEKIAEKADKNKKDSLPDYRRFGAHSRT